MTTETLAHHLSANALLNWRLRTVDDVAAAVSDLIIDTQVWAVRFLAADAQSWAPNRQVLVGTPAVAGVDAVRGEIDLALDAEYLRNGPVLGSGESPSNLKLRSVPPPGWEQQWRATVAPEESVPAPPPPAPETLAGAVLGSAADSGSLVRMATLNTCRVETADGVRTQIADLLIGDADWWLSYLDLAMGPDASRRVSDRMRTATRALVPRECIDWFDRDACVLYLTIWADELHDAALEKHPAAVAEDDRLVRVVKR
jgi:hypothetical protein